MLSLVLVSAVLCSAPEVDPPSASEPAPKAAAGERSQRLSNGSLRFDPPTMLLQAAGGLAGAAISAGFGLGAFLLGQRLQSEPLLWLSLAGALALPFAVAEGVALVGRLLGANGTGFHAVLGGVAGIAAGLLTWFALVSLDFVRTGSAKVTSAAIALPVGAIGGSLVGYHLSMYPHRVVAPTVSLREGRWTPGIVVAGAF